MLAGGDAETVRGIRVFAVRKPVSVTFQTILKVDGATVVVPEITPLDDKDSPEGSVPEKIDHA